MKKIITSLLLCLGWQFLLAQAVCGTDEMRRQLMKDDPSLKVRIKQYNEMIRQYINSRPQMRVQNGVQTPYLIPVVVHVIDDNPDPNVHLISEVEIYAAIDNMNVKYAGTGIQFKLAHYGAYTSGIDYIKASNHLDASDYLNYKNNGVRGAGITDEKLKSLGGWPPNLFYNIWVVNKITDNNGNLVSGYTNPPGGREEQDGTVIRVQSLNTTTLPHEAGHFFGLEHVFYGCWVPDPNDPAKMIMGDCDETQCPPSDSPGDGIDDTDPVSRSSSRRTGTGTNMCTNTPYNDNTECNIMSYTSCRDRFTQKQIDKMLANIEMPCGLRRSLARLPVSLNCNGNNSKVQQTGKALSKFDKQIRSVVSIDPNEKVGITTNTAANHVNGAASFSYNIYFENKNTATAPAQEVVIIDTLDKSKFDLSTFQLKSFGYGGSTKAYIPTGLTEYFVVDTLRRPGKPNLLVKTDAKLDTAKGILTWHFLSLDPQTRELVADPLDGFLPPNITSPQGEGYVSYSVAPKTSLTHETVIKNKAAIYFDNNAPIVTNEFLNTLDKVNPVSSVNPMPAQVYDPTFTVQWNGSDNGAGIRSYDVYYKVNNGEYKLWQYDVSLLSSEFPGQKDSTYSFFSISKDYAGNIEATKTTAERVVTVRMYDSSNTACASAITKFQATPAGADFTYHWQVNQGAGFVDIANNAIYSGTTTTELTLTTPPTVYTNYQYRCKISNGTVIYYSSKHAVKFVSTWVGTAGTAWETPANWSCGLVPDGNTHVIIANAVPHNPILNVNGTCKSLTIKNTSNLLIKSGANLIITGKLNN